VSRTPKEAKDESKPADAPTPPAEAPSPEKGGKKERTTKAKESKEGKEPKEGKGKARAGPAGRTAKVVPTNPNFRYIVRVANTDLDGTRSTALALTTVHGVGLRLAEATCRMARVDPHEMLGNLS